MLQNNLAFLKILCALFLLFPSQATISVAHASVVAYVKQTDSPTHIIQIADDDNARAQIDDIGGSQTRGIFLLHGTPEQLINSALPQTIAEILLNILNPPNGIAVTARINCTKIYSYISGDSGDAGDLYIFNELNKNSVQYGYSQTNISNQGQFFIDNGFLLYHTEPKAISEVFKQINANTGRNAQVQNVLLISEKPMCHCCARLLLDILNNNRNAYQNIIIISYQHFTYIKNKIPNIARNQFSERLVEQIKSIMANDAPSKNKLALLIRY